MEKPTTPEVKEKTHANKFGTILRTLRKDENLTQMQVSSILKIDRSNIANYERGKRLPPIESLIKIADFFNVSLDYLVLGKKTLRGKKNFADDINRELMAENTALMEAELKLHEGLKQKEEEIKLLKNYVDSLKNFNMHLESKIKESGK